MKKLTCIGCPMGCELRVHLLEGAVTAVEGNRCPRGGGAGRYSGKGSESTGR